MRHLSIISLVLCGILIAAPARADDEIQRRAPPPPSAPEEIQPVVEGEPGSSQFVDQAISKVLAWHAVVCRYVPEQWAWPLMGGAPTLLLLLLWVVIRRRRLPQPMRLPGKERKAPKVPQIAVPKKRQGDATEIPLELPRARLVLLSSDGGAPSIFESLLAVGIEEDTFAAFTSAVRMEGDASTWAAAVADRKPRQLESVRSWWIKQLGLRRVVSWMTDHPLVSEKLAVQEPNALEPSAVDSLALTQHDGLGANLSTEQQEVLATARKTLRGVLSRCVANPYEMFGLASLGIKSLIPSSVIGGPVSCYGVALLLGGLGALDRMRLAKMRRPELEEFRNAIAEHRQIVDAPVPAEGVAVHALTALDGGNVKGIGTMMASVAGAAYSTSSVVMRISKDSGDQTPLAGAAMGRVGALALEALTDLDKGEGKILAGNIEALLGMPLLKDEEQRMSELGRRLERNLSKHELWSDAARNAPERPDMALLGLYRSLVKRASTQAEAAQQRLFEILAALGNAGKDGSNLSIAQRRVGYVLAGLGMPVLRSMSTEMLSAAREALSSIKEEQEDDYY